MKCDERFYGKYRGTVINNVDPMQKGRVMVIVPDVSHIVPSSWAMPAPPSAGIQSGSFTLPPIGSGVWVEFEQGDADYPIWTGGFWGSAAEVPLMGLAAPPGLPPIVIQSMAQNRLIISSTPGDGIRLETALGPAGPTIMLTPLGIILSDGKGAMISLTAGTVMINMGALVIK